jgi:hypothetical protein
MNPAGWKRQSSEGRLRVFRTSATPLVSSVRLKDFEM